MSVKPEDIPQEIWDAADAIADSSVELHTRAEIDDLATKIARAIMAAVEEEREACAQIIERDGPQRYYNMHGQSRGLSEIEAHLSRCIRNRQSKDG